MIARSMRQALAWSLPTAALAVAWVIVEEPTAWTVGLPALLGLPLCFVRRVFVGAVLAGGASLALAGAVARKWPRGALGELGDGLRRAAEVGAPYNPGAEPELHNLVMVSVAIASVAIALAIVAQRPVLAGALAIAAIGYPATLHERHRVVLGIAVSIAALWPALLAGARAPRRLAVGAAFVVAATVTAVALGRVAGLAPEQAALAWQGWSPLGGNRSAATIRSIWAANYGGIDFPRKPTTVLRIRAPHRLAYWRASTLDLFADDRWLESLLPVELGPATRRLEPDGLGAETGRVVRQDVTVEAYADDRLPALTEPVAVSTTAVTRVFALSGGVLFAPAGISRGDRYTIWSRVPRPSPAELASAGTGYPSGLGRYLGLGHTEFLAFGSPGRVADTEARFDPERYPELSAYAPLWRKARSLTRRARSPYEAAIAIESWLRATGGFGYTESPPAPPAGVPPLVDFATRTKLGYCQHYAGTMALMLRTLGVPSRVAVGFTSGRWRDGEWIVTDHEAHAWVEVWFPRFGWLPFDPTPGRGTISADYTIASDSADAVRALGTGRFLQPEAVPKPPTVSPGAATTRGPARGRVPWWGVIAVSLALVGMGVVPGLKAARRLQRFRTSEPRALAAAVRLDLAELLRDHGVELPAQPSLARLRAELARLGVDARALEADAARARYARPDESRDAARRLERGLRAVRDALRESRGRLATLRATYSLRSLRAAVTDGMRATIRP
ncbi:MAG: transglutaminaseTgpA domain-containing protein [Gaiellales bacterium]